MNEADKLIEMVLNHIQDFVIYGPRIFSLLFSKDKKFCGNGNVVQAFSDCTPPVCPHLSLHQINILLIYLTCMPCLFSLSC